jgi:hypothetical protein
MTIITQMNILTEGKEVGSNLLMTFDRFMQRGGALMVKAGAPGALRPRCAIRQYPLR